MTNETEKTYMHRMLSTFALSVGILVGVVGFIQAWTVLPYRVEAHEKRILILEDTAKRNREMLVECHTMLLDNKSTLGELRTDIRTHGYFIAPKP
jgi:hypothetical protein